MRLGKRGLSGTVLKKKNSKGDLLIQLTKVQTKEKLGPYDGA